MSEAELDKLYQYLQASGVFGERWETGRPLLGGSTTSLIVTAYAKEHHVPSTAELKEGQREQAKALIEGVRAFVPMEIWDKMEDKVEY